MIASFLLAFFRVTTDIVFMMSFWGKAQNLSGFSRVISNFAILPRRLSTAAAVLFLIGELITMVLIFVGGRFLTVAFILASFLLLIFTVALVSVLIRNIQTPCNCFGTNDQPVTANDLWRNSGFILCAASGWIISRFSDVQPLNWLEWSVTIIPALVFVMVMTHLDEITALFQPVREN